MSQSKVITWQQLSKHISPNDCWILIDGTVYNVSDFIVEHPGGDEPLLKNSGLDATQKFASVGHSEYAVSLRNARKVGPIQSSPCPENHNQTVKQRKKQYQINRNASSQTKRQASIANSNKQRLLSTQLISRHNSEEDCWIIIDGKVIQVTEYLGEHPGGISAIMQYAGKDATKAFEEAGHSLQAIQKKDSFLIGQVEKKSNLMIIMLVLMLLASVGYFLVQ